MSKAQLRSKPPKPYPSFPLTPHPNGQWVKKIRGKLHFFGTWADPESALARFHASVSAIHAGRDTIPDASSTDCTVKILVNRFLQNQSNRVEAGQIGARWFEDCRRALRHFSRRVGGAREVERLTVNDFQTYRTGLTQRGLAGRKGLGVHALTRTLVIVRGMFAWGLDSGFIDRLPRWAGALEKPSAADRRRQRAKAARENGNRLLLPSEIRALLNAANPMLKAAIYLGINGGFGNTDCSELPLAAIDFDNARIEFERPKTAVGRVVPLWPETVQALRAHVEHLSAAYDEYAIPLAFRTETGRALVRQVIERESGGLIKKSTAVDRLGDRFKALLKEIGIKRLGIGFYALRHTFRTWADEIHDQHAIAVIMGHAIGGMAGNYIEEIGFERLKRVTDNVRAKLLDS